MNKLLQQIMGPALRRLLLVALMIVLVQPVHAERIKDLASIQGVRSNQLLGYGLIVGLDGSGDKAGSSPFTRQSLRNLLTQLGIVVPPGVALNPKNVAAVTVHADMPPFAKPGQQIDVTVSSIGDAKSLRGGSLLMTPMKGIDGQVYAIAQGNLVVGGLAAEGGEQRIRSFLLDDLDHHFRGDRFDIGGVGKARLAVEESR